MTGTLFTLRVHCHGKAGTLFALRNRKSSVGNSWDWCSYDSRFESRWWHIEPSQSLSARYEHGIGLLTPRCMALASWLLGVWHWPPDSSVYGIGLLTPRCMALASWLLGVWHWPPDSSVYGIGLLTHRCMALASWLLGAWHWPPDSSVYGIGLLTPRCMALASWLLGAWHWPPDSSGWYTAIGPGCRFPPLGFLLVSFIK